MSIDDRVEKWVFLNGSFYLEKEASIPVTDRGFLFGDGIFTTIRADQGKCEFLKAHLSRLRDHAAMLELEMNIDDKRLCGWISELIEKQKAWDGVWRLKVIITVREEGLRREQGLVLLTLQPYEEMKGKPCSLCVYPYPTETPFSRIKSLSYLSNLSIGTYARKKGCDDAVAISHEGFILETGRSNLFWVDGGKCWIPDPSLPILKGIFLHSILPCLPYPIEPVKAKLEEIPLSANVFVCNSLSHVRPVVSVEGKVYQRNSKVEAALEKAIVMALEQDIFSPVSL